MVGGVTATWLPLVESLMFPPLPVRSKARLSRMWCRVHLLRSRACLFRVLLWHLHLSHRVQRSFRRILRIRPLHKKEHPRRTSTPPTRSVPHRTATQSLLSLWTALSAPLSLSLHPSPAPRLPASNHFLLRTLPQLSVQYPPIHRHCCYPAREHGLRAVIRVDITTAPFRLLLQRKAVLRLPAHRQQGRSTHAPISASILIFASTRLHCFFPQLLFSNTINCNKSLIPPNRRKSGKMTLTVKTKQAARTTVLAMTLRTRPVLLVNDGVARPTRPSAAGAKSTARVRREVT
mmetsp:Transcript_1295/g.3996  ORF Transcript_1295/g.3996 Transcript_1295/m.3996 type:complete len:290 (-) Transcript_1295:1695-2564(-)